MSRHGLLGVTEATQSNKASQQHSAGEHQAGTASHQPQAGRYVTQQVRDPHNRPVALETPKDQYNRHLEAARSRSGSLGPKHGSPRHASPLNGDSLAC